MKTNIVVLVRDDGTVEKTEMSGYAAESTADSMVYKAQHESKTNYLFGVHIERYDDGFVGRRGTFGVPECILP